MPIGVSDGTQHNDDYALQIALAEGGTQVPTSENNAPVTSVEAPRPLPEQRPRVYISKADTKLPDVESPLIPDGGEFSKGTKIGNKLFGTGGEERYQTWPEKAIRSAFDALAAPGEAYQGKLPMWAADPETGEVHTSPQAVEKAQELGNLAVFGPAPVAAKMADGTLGSFIGIKAKTFDRNNLAQAQILERNGEHIDDVFKQTGMFRGADNRWRYEIPDKDAKFKQDWFDNPTKLGDKLGQKVSSLPEVLDHPELYKAYPELKDVNVVYNPSNPGAHYDMAKNAIEVGDAYKNSKETILHEIQHKIQETEGFAKGGAPARDFKLRYEDDVAKAQAEAHDFLKQNQDIKNGLRDSFSKKEQDRIFQLKEILDKNVLYRKAALKEAEVNYMRLAGEVEARNVETRMELGPEGRRISPRWTEDVHRNQQHAIDTVEWATPYGYGNPLVVPSKAMSTKLREIPTENYRGPMSKHTDTLYRESSPSDALIDIPGSNSSGGSPFGNRKYYADHPDMATGQHGNKGVLIEYDSKNFEGSINKEKPAWDIAYQNGMGEYLAEPSVGSNIRDSVKSITIDSKSLSKVESAQYQRIIKHLKEKGWETSKDGDKVIIRRPEYNSVSKINDTDQAGGKGEIAMRIEHMMNDDDRAAVANNPGFSPYKDFRKSDNVEVRNDSEEDIRAMARQGETGFNRAEYLKENHPEETLLGWRLGLADLNQLERSKARKSK